MALGDRLPWYWATSRLMLTWSSALGATGTVRNHVPAAEGRVLVCPIENGATGHRIDHARCRDGWRSRDPLRSRHDRRPTSHRTGPSGPAV
jgi:hypothetical protein